MTPPLGTLEYLYLGKADFDRDCGYDAKVLVFASLDSAEREGFEPSVGLPRHRFSRLTHQAAPARENTAFRLSRVPILPRAYAGAYAYPAPRSPPAASRTTPWVWAADHCVAKSGPGRARERPLRDAVRGVGGGRAAASALTGR